MKTVPLLLLVIGSSIVTGNSGFLFLKIENLIPFISKYINGILTEK